jgi:hypothetical protein
VATLEAVGALTDSTRCRGKAEKGSAGQAEGGRQVADRVAFTPFRPVEVGRMPAGAVRAFLLEEVRLVSQRPTLRPKARRKSFTGGMVGSTGALWTLSTLPSHSGAAPYAHDATAESGG